MNTFNYMTRAVYIGLGSFWRGKFSILYGKTNGWSHLFFSALNVEGEPLLFSCPFYKHLQG